MSRSPRIGILGGTFDPIHRGHIEPVAEIAESFAWERIVVIPAFRQPFKQSDLSASGYHRFAMAVLACEGDPRFRVSPIELERGEVSYTVDTLEALMSRGDAELDWLIGDDQLASLDRWRSLDRILELANLVVLRRSGETETLPAALRVKVADRDGRGPSGAMVFAENRIVSISATDIRRQLREGKGVEDCLNQRVAEYIARAGLYQDVSASGC